MKADLWAKRSFFSDTFRMQKYNLFLYNQTKTKKNLNLYRLSYQAHRKSSTKALLLITKYPAPNHCYLYFANLTLKKERLKATHEI